MKLLACFLLLPILSLAQSQRGVMLGDLTWQQAEKILTPETIVVIPLGAEAKEHGPHLLLKNDLILAEYFQQRVLQETNVVIAPMINYHFYPSFLEYPGSTSLRLSTARDLVIDICRRSRALRTQKVLHIKYGHQHSTTPTPHAILWQPKAL